MKSAFLSLLALLLCAISSAMLAQNTVRYAGSITDANTGEFIRGASVEIENTFFGTISDNSGHFSISTSTTLPFWMVCKRAGYQMVRIQVTKADAPIAIKMKSLGGTSERKPEISAPEYTAKLAFVERLSQLATFPDKATITENSPFVIGIFGANPFGEDLFVVEAHKAHNRKITVRFTDSVETISQVDVLFLPNQRIADDRLDAIVKQAQQSGVLLIADDKKLAARGAMIAFSLVDSNIRFVINKSSLSKAGITLPQQLLDMALPE